MWTSVQHMNKTAYKGYFFYPVRCLKKKKYPCAHFQSIKTTNYFLKRFIAVQNAVQQKRPVFCMEYSRVSARKNAARRSPPGRVFTRRPINNLTGGFERKTRANVEFYLYNMHYSIFTIVSFPVFPWGRGCEWGYCVQPHDLQMENYAY